VYFFILFSTQGLLKTELIKPVELPGNIISFLLLAKLGVYLKLSHNNNSGVSCLLHCGPVMRTLHAMVWLLFAGENCVITGSCKEISGGELLTVQQKKSLEHSSSGKG
jgi:hypothetical protein